MSNRRLKKFFSVLLLLFLFLPTNSRAAMSSTNYYIYADTVGVSGVYSASGTIYSLQDTLGESAPAGTSSSSSYTVKGGYQAMDRKYLTLNVSSASLGLGTLDTTAKRQATTTVSVVTDGDTGYTLSFSAVSGAHLSDVSDGAVSGDGTEEYGFAAVGEDSLIAGDAAVSAPLNVASRGVYSTSTRETVLVFKAARSATTAQGSYAQSITITGSVNY